MQQPDYASPGVVQFGNPDRPFAGGYIGRPSTIGSRLSGKAILRQPPLAVHASAAGDCQPQIEHVANMGAGWASADLENIGKAFVTHQPPLHLVPATLV